MPVLWITKVNTVYNNCVEHSEKSYYLDRYTKQDRIEEKYNIQIRCNEIAWEAWTWPWILWDSIIIPLIMFYILQLLFFKLGVDFIYLGSKK